MGFWAFRWSSRLRFQAEFPVPECKRVWRLSGVNAAVFRFKREQCPYYSLANAGEIILTRRIAGRRNISYKPREQPQGACEKPIKQGHCAWFRELPSGILDGLSPEVLQCNTEEESIELVRQLKPTEAALLNWAINLMADVVEEEKLNKMNARSIAMVFSPNMTQMSDPLTALMHAVQVMNLLRTLIMKKLREREENDEIGGYSPMSSGSSDHQTDEDSDDSQQEMDTGSELEGSTSDYEENAHSIRSSKYVDEVRSVSETEECLLRHLGENKTAGNSLLLADQPTGELHREYLSPQSCLSFNMDSGTSFCDSKNGNSSFSTTSDGESPIWEMYGCTNVHMEIPSSASSSNTNKIEIVDR